MKQMNFSLTVLYICVCVTVWLCYFEDCSLIVMLMCASYIRSGRRPMAEVYVTMRDANNNYTAVALDFDRRAAPESQHGTELIQGYLLIMC